MRATASASPFGTVPSRRAATHSALSNTRPAAVADRAVTALLETSTMRASPVAPRCGKRPSLTAAPRSSRGLIKQPHVDLLRGRYELRVFRQDHQGVRASKISEQVGAVSASQPDLPGARACRADDPPG